jgi:hypothetical protein
MKRWPNNVTAILPERLLHAYVDVLLPPAKRLAVEAALLRNPQFRDTVDVWRQQNAGLRRLATLESPPPMPPEMAGTVHRLEGRLYRRAPLEFLRIAATITLLVAGGFGAAIITQQQIKGHEPLPGLAKEAADAHRTLSTLPLGIKTVADPVPSTEVIAAPAIVPVGSPAEQVEPKRAPDSVERRDDTADTKPELPNPPAEQETPAPTPLRNLPQDPADPPRET